MGFLKWLLIVALARGCLCAEDSDHYAEEILMGDNSYSESQNLGKSAEARYYTWILSLLASCVIGLSGIAPLIFIPLEMCIAFGEEGGSKYLKLLLSFAVGGLLGDVFLHLLPEAWNYHKNLGELGSNHMVLGLWVILGMFSFIILELMFTASKTNSVPQNNCDIMKDKTCFDKVPCETKFSRNHCLASDSPDESTIVYRQKSNFDNGHVKTKGNLQDSSSIESRASNNPIHVAGYLNLMANSIDNFTHGLAVAASFLIGCKTGILTTFAILIHEIPHEIGDFAILLKSGFHPWTAAKAQFSTSTIGIFGVIVALSAESIDEVGICTSWILPFTAGGFLNIALVNVLPDLLNEKDTYESIKQLVCICAGIAVMALVSILV